MNSKLNIRDLDYQQLVKELENLTKEKFRAKQVYEWLWYKSVVDFEEMSNLPNTLRKLLDNKFYIDFLEIIFKQESKDKTIKFLFQSIDKHKFEGVLIPSQNRITACISTQVACPLNCSFCATGKLGFKRNLSSGEIFEQIFKLNKLSEQIFNKKLSNIVIMGMGEPLLNYENVLKAIEHIMDKQSLFFSPQRITLSTAGIVEGIKKMADDNLKIHLSISLHSADDKKRSLIMPINKKYNLDSLKKAILYYYQKTKKRITYEYLLLGGLNDSLEDAKKLTEFTKISPCKINLIEYNHSSDSLFKASSKKNTEDFINFIENKNLIVTLRKSKGQDINAACGQLANKNENFNN
ncbi:MAG: 23S rRNA (adenine(2503)-C(2))-methyltransferase RlmN [Bacteroidales bacterium]|nr:23S rRNA (adenine(2503)-C(2))-methyltransferase RlmN [Bacteroidales bacterium]MCK9498378.1 23S rRNA (adenine(2503)-C(2))-methyltransferase RlmN [Bacteroidales bacterium]NLB86374.1 23S rRNA (adenine(2503)-C(2))-methyltransferase RlmN [Bacteroidales bacterium]